MSKLIALMTCVLMAGIALSGVTTHFALDTRMGVRELPEESVSIRYDASWHENGASAKIEDNGTEVASGVSGDFAWLPTDDGAHTLKLSVFDGEGSLVGSETAKFGEIVEYTYDGFVPTTKTKLWSGFSAMDIVRATGYFCSEWVDFPCDETAYNLKKDGASVTVQFQHLEGTCVKCVGVKFLTESDGVYAQAIYSRYVSGADKLGIDFDTCSYSSNTPGASEGWDRGYCVKNLRVEVASTGGEGADSQGSWSGRSITPSDWLASNNNVLRGLEGTFSGSRYYEAGRVSTSDPLSRLTDGMVNAAGSTYGNTVGIISGTLTWQLADPVDLSCLRINTHWCDGGRDGINLTSVEIQQGGSSVWTVLPNSSFSFGMDNDDSSGDLEIVYANGENSVFVENVTAIRFNLGTQDNDGSGFTEFEAIGIASEIGVAVSSVAAQQRYPWNGLVDVAVMIRGSAEDVAEYDCVFAATNSATKAAIPVGHITQNGDDTGSGTTWTRKFIWDAKADVGAVKIDDVALTVDVERSLGGIQLWENGPYWAECNVGASQPEEYGYYFWWGDTVGYKRNANNSGWISVKDSTSFSFSSDNCPTCGKNNSELQSAGYIDATGNLVAAHDAATAHLGAPWRMPTDAEISALVSNCDTEWTSRNGVAGRLIKGRGAYASKSIFLPAAGYGPDSRFSNGFGSYGLYWSSTPRSDDFDYAWFLNFGSGYFNRDSGSRNFGRSVRPVRGFANASGSIVFSDNAVATHLSLDARTGARELPEDSVNVRYDASWYESGVLAKIEDNGEMVASGASGVLAWLPTGDSAHTLKLSVFDGVGSLVGSETAKFGDGSDSSTNETADLVHRWSFNGDLTDSVGGQTATVIGSVMSENGQYKLAGGSRGSSYINLGADVLPKRGQGATIEIWAMQNAIQSWSRIWDVGTNEGTESLGEMYAAWTSESTLNAAPVCIRNVAADKGNLAPYSLGIEYHIAAVFEPQDDGTWKVKFYKQDAKTGTTSASYTISTSSSSNWSLSNQAQGSFYLGHSHHATSYDASASYNEVRVWSRALTEAELTANALLGPDVLPGGSTDPETPINTITFDANGGTCATTSKSYESGATLGTLPTATRSGFTFDGWFTAASGGTQVTAATVVTGDTTLYAHWGEIDGGGDDPVVPVTPTIKFDGSMYGWWAEDGESEIWGYYGDYGADPESADWADDFVDVKGSKEPGTCPGEGYAFPVTITPGTTFTPEIVDASTDANFATVSMKTDAEMRTMMSEPTEEDGAEWWFDQVWPNGQTDSARAWVVVLVTDVPKGDDCYTFDLTTKSIVDGSKSMKAYAQQYGATLPDTLEIPKSISFKVGIKETGEVFPERLWALYNPANNTQYRAAVNKVDSSGGDSEMFHTPGLWLVTQEMIDEQNGTVSFTGDYFAIADDRGESDDEWAESKLFTHDYSDNGGIWQEFLVDVGGKKEPAQFGDKNSRGFAIPVALSGGATLSAQDVEVVVDSSESGYIRTVEVKTDQEMSGWDGFPYGQTDASRVWIVIRQNALSVGVQYECDLTGKLAANGRKMTEWAAENGETFPQSVQLPVSASYVVRIKERNLEFPEHFWNVYNPMLDRLDAFDGEDYEEEDYIEYPGLWLVTQEMIDEQQGAGVVEVTFDTNGGTCSTTSKSCESGAAVGELPTATRSGYAFDGWYTAASGGTQVTATTVVTGDTTLYAHWTAMTVADTETVDGITWTYTVSGGKATIGNGSSAAISINTTGAIAIPSTLGGCPVTGIGDGAFDGCSQLTVVIMPLGVESIGEEAFHDCSGLRSVIMPSSLRTIGECAFEDCTGLRMVNIPDGVTCIMEDAFDGCSALESVRIPSTVTELGDWVFFKCFNLATIFAENGDVARIRGFFESSYLYNYDMKPVRFLEERVVSHYSVIAGAVGKELLNPDSGVPYLEVDVFDHDSCAGDWGDPVSLDISDLPSGLSVERQGVAQVPGWGAPWCPERDGYYPLHGKPAKPGVCVTTMTATWADGVEQSVEVAFCISGEKFDGTMYGWWAEDGESEIWGYYGDYGADPESADWADDFVDVNGSKEPGTCPGEGYAFPVTIMPGATFTPEIVEASTDANFATVSMKTDAEMRTMMSEPTDEVDGAKWWFDHVWPNGRTDSSRAWVVVLVTDVPKGVDCYTFDLTTKLIADGSKSMKAYAQQYDATLPDALEIPKSISFKVGIKETGEVFPKRLWALYNPANNTQYRAAVNKVDASGGDSEQFHTPGLWLVTQEMIDEQREAIVIADPIVNPPDGTVFKGDSCTVTISCATEGAEIYYTTNGRTPRIADANRYTGPFTISDTATIIAVAVKGDKTSEYVEATITKVIPEPLTLVGVLDEPKLADVTTGGDAEWLPIEDETAKVGGSCAVSGMVDETDEVLRETWLEAKVYGKGTLTFWWRVSCEPDPRGRYTYDFASFEADDEVVVRKDGETGWVQVTKTFATDGEHVFRWRYNTDGWPCEDYDGCVWVDGVTWSGSAAPEEPSKPTVEGDEGATVTGDAETGFVVRPSEGKTAVEVTIPGGIDAGRVTVEVSVKVTSVKPNGAKVKIVSGGADITEFLNVPTADGSGVVDLTKATVKEEIVKEVLDVEKGAVIDLSGGSQGTASPTITTGPTRVGLFYQLREGETLGGMKDGDSTVGDGQPWTPEIKVKGGNSAFYSIEVGKGVRF